MPRGRFHQHQNQIVGHRTSRDAVKTYNLKTGSREYIDKSIGDLVRQWNARPVSSMYCGG